MAIILASASPRRSELLNQIGCNFAVITSDVIENNHQGIPPKQLVIAHAKAKALAVAAKASSDDVIIGADTIVVLDGKVFGKPNDVQDAKKILRILSGREHQVITGIALVRGKQVLVDYSITLVKMAEMSDKNIDKYIASGEPMDKAGAYAIQGKGAIFVESITGCYSNVVGLPLSKLAKLLDKVGVYVP